MNFPHRVRVAATFLFTLLAVGALWFFFAPTQFGGRVDYAVIHGVSMQPELHAGDLAIIRSRPSYAVGQVVGYKSGLLHELVLHRIIAEKNGHFLFKGDSNKFIDSYYPTSNELVGRLWFQIPHAGAALTWLRMPDHAAVIGALIAVLIVAGGGAFETRRQRSRRDVDGEPPTSRNHRPSLLRRERDVWTVLGCALGAAVCFAIFTNVSFSRPSQAMATDPTAYVQSASYSYRASTPVSTVYPSGSVHTGDPIYINLVRRLTLDLRYRFSSQMPHAVGGTIALQVHLHSGGGWTQLLASAPARDFRGDTAAATIRLDLAHLRNEMSAFRSESDVTNESFTLLVSSRVRLHGTVDGRPIMGTLTPTPLIFNTDDQSVELAQTTSAGGIVGASTPDPLKTTQTGSVDRLQPAALSLAGLRLSLHHAREIGLVGTLAALLLAVAMLMLARGDEQLDELGMIHERYGSWLIPVNTPLAGTNIVEVATIESLVSLAEHYDSPILYEQHGQMHVFAIEQAGTLYRYQVGESRVDLRAMTDVGHRLPAGYDHPSSAAV